MEGAVTRGAQGISVTVIQVASLGMPSLHSHRPTWRVNAGAHVARHTFSTCTAVARQAWWTRIPMAAPLICGGPAHAIAGRPCQRKKAARTPACCHRSPVGRSYGPLSCTTAIAPRRGAPLPLRRCKIAWPGSEGQRMNAPTVSTTGANPGRYACQAQRGRQGAPPKPCPCRTRRWAQCSSQTPLRRGDDDGWCAADHLLSSLVL